MNNKIKRIKDGNKNGYCEETSEDGSIIKAYYIVMTFMHLGDEKNQLQFSIVAPMFVLVPYLLFILLVEASFHGAIG